MNQQTTIPADEVVDAEVTAADSIAISLERVRTDVAAFDKIEQGLRDLNERHPVNLVVDVTTPAGMKVAVAGRAAYRDPRTALERARKTAKAPVLDLGRKIDAYAASIEERLRIGEANYDEQIRVETERKAREKKEQEEREAARVQQIQQRIAFHFTSVPIRMIGKSAAELKAAMLAATFEITEAEYQELTQDAVTAQMNAVMQLGAMQQAQERAEAEALQQRTQAEENARKARELQEQQAAFEAEQRAMRERIQREDNERREREAAERAARQAEQDKIDAARAALALERQQEADRKAAAERAEQDRIAAEARAKADAEAAEARRIADEQFQAEEKRRRDERAAEEAAAAEQRAEEKRKADALAAKQRRAAAKLAQAQKCGPRLLAALKALSEDVQANAPIGHVSKAIIDEADAAIAEAEAE
jgi:hypothetical protein